MNLSIRVEIFKEDDEVPVTHIRTNMKTAGMSRERYFELLEQVE